MLMVFPEITEKMNRLMEIEYDDIHWEEADKLKLFMRENDGYARYNLQLKFSNTSDSLMNKWILMSCNFHEGNKQSSDCKIPHYRG